MFKSLALYFVLLPCLSLKLFSQPTSEEIAAALDDDLGAMWSITTEGEGIPMIEVISDPEAQNGTALKLTVPGNASLILERELPEDAVVTFDYKIDISNLRRLLVFSGGRFGEPRPIVEESKSEWTEEFYQKDEPDVFGWRIVDYSIASSDQVIWLDNFSYSPGFRVQVEGIGIEVAKTPDKQSYAIGEYVTIDANPPEEGHEFLYWMEGSLRLPLITPLSEVYNFGPTRIELIDHRVVHEFLAVAGRKYTYGELEVTVPANLNSVETLDENNLEIFEVSPPGNDQYWILLEANGPGLIKYKAEGSGKVNRTTIDTLAGEPIEKSLWFAPGQVKFELPLEGNLKIGSFQFVKGFPLEIAVSGLGSVDGTPTDAFSSLGGSLSLTAVPEDGWEFSHWEGTIHSYNNPLEITTNRYETLKAVFFRTAEFLGFQTKIFGIDEWTLETVGESSFIRSPEFIGGLLRSRLQWEFDGPGQFAFEYESDDRLPDVFLNGELFHNIDSTQGTPRMVEMELVPGKNLVEIVADNVFATSEFLELTIKYLTWTPGFKIRKVSSAGGSISGIASGESRVDPGTVLNLTAEPDEGNNFISWNGSLAGNNPMQEIAVFSDLEIFANFHTPVTDDLWVTHLGGNQLWSKVEGQWTTPETLA